MPANQAAWDEKHRAAAEAPPPEPASIVRELLAYLPKGPALDIACGTGRHSLLLAARGQHVTSADFSSVALDALAMRALSMRIAARHSDQFHHAARHGHGLELIQTDLEAVQLPEDSFDLILCVQYLQRSLSRQMARALRPNGFLLMETFTKAQLEFSAGPRNPDYLLETGELREAFPELSTVFYRELRAGVGIASLVAKKVSSRS